MTVAAGEVPQHLLGRWALVAGRIDDADSALGRGGASRTFDEWTISPDRVENSWGALGIGKVEELPTERIALVSMKGGIQYLMEGKGGERLVFQEPDGD